jgi:hypothetical protein
MRIEAPQPLPGTVLLPCYACEKDQATHVCRFIVGELTIQVCLCPECMKMDTGRLIKNTIGIQGIAEQLVSNYSVDREVPLRPRPANRQ